MKRGYLNLILAGICILFAITYVVGQNLSPLREQKLKYGPSLYILGVNITPPEIQPGSSSIITIRLYNVAPHPLRDIIINLELPSQFAPAETTKKKIRSIEGEEVLNVSFDVIALPNSDEGIYKVPLAISYLDEIGNEYRENNTISLRISAEPKIFIGLSNSDIYEGNLLGKVSIRIANTGIGDIKFLIAELISSADYDILGPEKVYVGEIPSDDYETIEFKINAKNSKEMDLLLKLSYADSNNKEYTRIIEIPVDIRSAKDLGIKQNKNNLFIFAIIGSIVLFLIYKKIRNMSKKK